MTFEFNGMRKGMRASEYRNYIPPIPAIKVYHPFILPAPGFHIMSLSFIEVFAGFMFVIICHAQYPRNIFV